MAGLLHWLTRYGYGAIFSMLVLGIVGVPVPDEVLLLVVGQFAHHGILHLPLALLTAWAGAACGITGSFLLGRLLGMAVLQRNRRIKPQHLQRVERWLERRGKWTFVLGYFIPGFRHLAAMVAGASGWPWKHFVPYAYAGAAMWTSSFVMAGFLLGDDALDMVPLVHRYLLVIAAVTLGALAAGVGIWLLRRRRQTTPTIPGA